MSDYNKLVPQSAEHQNSIAGRGEVHSAAGPVRESTGLDPSMLLEYHEAVAMINIVQGELQIKVAGKRLVERAEEGLPGGLRTKVMQSDILPVQANLPIPEVTAPPSTFSDLVERFSNQMQEVIASGKQITAATRLMSDGVQKLNKGVGTLKQKLDRVKY